jgi:hypothetical protein
MAHTVLGAIEVACARRFPAWTLYARTFSGNRTQADYLVQNAVAGAWKWPARPATELEVHAQVLSSIRSRALRSPEIFTSAPAGSVLALLREPGELESAQRDAVRRLRDLPRAARRSIERVLLRRPSWSIERVAAHGGVSSACVTASIETGLHYVAAGVHRMSGELSRSASGAWAPESHPPLEASIAYVRGALGADEARALVSHGSSCLSCGDRLGTMMLLRAASIERFRLPLVRRGTRRALSGLLAFVLLATGILVVRRMMPNPWREQATRESVPRWFHTFLYRGDGPGSASEISRGLSLLVEGKYREAIEALEPWARGRDANPEAATYLGIARYLSGDSSRGTVRLLKSGTSSSRSGRLARWYLANVLLARGDVEGATAQLTELATLGDWFGRAAKALLEKLESVSTDEAPSSIARAIARYNQGARAVSASLRRAPRPLRLESPGALSHARGRRVPFFGSRQPRLRRRVRGSWFPRDRR